MRKAWMALALGYACSLVWVIVADVVFHNDVPQDRIEFHGLYPLGLGLSAALVAKLADGDLRGLAMRWPGLRWLAIGAAIAAGTVLTAFGANLALGLTRLDAAPPLDWGLVAIGLPVLVVLGWGEEAMWRGYLYAKLRPELGFTKTSALIGVLWALWHYPVILHTHFIYADLAPVHAIGAITLMTFSASFVTCWLRERSGSVWPAVVWHAVVNYVAFAIVIPLEADTSALSAYFRLDTGVFFLALNVAGALLAVRCANQVGSRSEPHSGLLPAD